MTQPLAGKQILIVEDEPVFRSLLHGWLTSLGATTFQAEDGKDALHKMTEVHPDLMILRHFYAENERSGAGGNAA